MPYQRFTIFLLSALILACSDGSDRSFLDQEQTLRMNQIQVLGTHNSYHIQPRDEILEALALFQGQAVADSLEYTALPLREQLDRGVRQLELDLFADPEGGLYANRRGLIVIGDDPASGIPALDEPGTKVLHVQDVDFETHCLTFIACLEELRAWSDSYPGHLPVIVMLEGKDEPIPDPLDLGFTVPLAFGPEELATLETEILQVFPRERLVKPDDVRGDLDTLEEAVLNGGWPTLKHSRGKFMFTLLNGGDTRAHYLEGNPSLEGRIMFTSSVVGEPSAAWFRVDDALNDFQEIRNLVAAGYIVRTRADADTVQAREGDYALQDAAWDSGGQTVSTDYVVPDPDFGTGYKAEVPGGYVGRCNPISAPPDCNSDLIAP
jgi:hypothetical protein